MLYSSCLISDTGMCRFFYGHFCSSVDELQGFGFPTSALEISPRSYRCGRFCFLCDLCVFLGSFFQILRDRVFDLVVQQHNSVHKALGFPSNKTASPFTLPAISTLSPLLFHATMTSESADVVPIADLLLLRRPISATATITTTTTTSSPPSSPHSTHPNPNPNPNFKILTSLPRPSIVIGTLTLPVPENVPSRTGHDCFMLSDDSGSVCCDVLRFDLGMIGRRIRVLSWNFVPFECEGGVLEVIEWRLEGFGDEGGAVVGGEFGGGGGSGKRRYAVTGVLRSVSPVEESSGMLHDDSGNDDGGKRRTCGFIVQIMSCVCELCGLVGERGGHGHSFAKDLFVYLSGRAASWHPVFLKLAGKLICLCSLIKKLIYIDKEEGVVMFVTTRETQLCLPRERIKVLHQSACGVKGLGECGAYSGIVRGIHLKGMVVELDKEVWLLLADPWLTPSHSIRVGAVILVKNVHFINPNFPWRKMLVLGACCKSSITVVSFSPLEERCHILLQSQTLLEKFVKCLPFSARLWLLLVVQCFRKKFRGLFFEKELLGSKHNEGLCLQYARSILPSAENHSMGLLFQFCKRHMCGCRDEVNYAGMPLAVPFANLVNNCEVLWIKSLLQSAGGLNVLDQNLPRSDLLLDRRFSGQVTRRSFRSQDIGVSLLGNLKVSPYTGRLQLVDATGGIDVMVLDLPSTWSITDFFEVVDYRLVLEGVPEKMNNALLPDSDVFSCRNIFNPNKSLSETGIGIHVVFPWRNTIRRCISSCRGPRYNQDLVDLECGIFHMLRMTHIFPLRPHLRGIMLDLDKSSMLAEAVVLPCNLYVMESDGASCPMGIPKEPTEEHALSGSPFKRPKIDHACDLVQQSGVNHPESVWIRPCSHLVDVSTLPVKWSGQKSHFADCVESPCFGTFRGPRGESVVKCRILVPNRDAGSSSISSKSKKVLLEFRPEYFYMYKLLRIGTYYIRKHYEKDCLCYHEDQKLCHKVVVGPGRHLWSLSYSPNEFLSQTNLSHNQPCHCFTNDISAMGCSRDALSHGCVGISDDGYADIHLQVSTDAIGSLDPDRQASKEGNKTSTRFSQYHQMNWDARGLSSVEFPVASHSACPLLEGDFISIHGAVIALYSSEFSSMDRRDAGGIHQLKAFRGKRIFISVHVSADGHLVKIDGSLSKLNYPVGLGPGANASFHRILALRGQNRLILLPVTFISVNLTPSSRFGGVPGDICSWSPICDMPKGDKDDLHCFCGKVVAVHILTFKRIKKLDKVPSEIQCRIPVIDIPIASFVLDDGVSPRCCWANGEKAAVFLRLHDDMPEIESERSWWEVQLMAIKDPNNNLSFLLDEILKKHGSITVRNYGSMLDYFFQDIQLQSGSDYKISISDENVLKFITLNCCSGSLLKVAGRVMCPGGASEFEKYLVGEQMKMDVMPNIWVEDVQVANPLAEARATLKALDDP
ncbi:hypothetical protein Drorol1_Dr00006686 [Drosera rotundifolia]